MAKTRSPLKQKPLNNPGESLRQQLDDVLIDKVLFWAMFTASFVVFAGIEWYRYLFNTKPSPMVMSVSAGVVVVIAIFKLRRTVGVLRKLRQGLDGEKAVGQFLEGLRSQGYQVFHDICENGYNIDHVLIGPTGVYAIETKTISKPTDRDATILYDGQVVLVDGRQPDRDPLKQANAGADRIQEILQRVTGKPVSVRPVVVYPGWFVQKRCRSPKVWVANENHLPAYLDHESEYLAGEDVRSYAAILANHIRSSSGVQ